jgi:hypothetical protein
MARFYFDVTTGGETAVDGDGIDLPSLAAALERGGRP